MEMKVVTDLNPAYEEIYLAALRENGLSAYAKQFNLDAWIRSIDIFLVYSDEADLRLAARILRDLERPIEAEFPAELDGLCDREPAARPDDTAEVETTATLIETGPAMIAAAFAEALDRQLDELIGRQRDKLLHLARTREPDLTAEELPQARERLELLNWPVFQYEDGLLAGLLEARQSLRAHLAR